MKKLIFKKLITDINIFFLLAVTSVTIVIWVIQAVNFLDIVSEDGHGFTVYFFYTIFNLPKIISKILPFIFLISLINIFIKYELNNELIIFWLLGISKLKFINIIITNNNHKSQLHFLRTYYPERERESPTGEAANSPQKDKTWK